MMESLGNALLRLGLALLLSALVGIERGLAHKPAGMRTHILVGFGSALFLVVSSLSGLDESRVAAGLITGIGFLGAGTILHDRGTVVGLTTAASIWTVAAIGIAAARGLWVLATIATVGTLLILWVFHFLEEQLEQFFGNLHKPK